MEKNGDTFHKRHLTVLNYFLKDNDSFQHAKAISENVDMSYPSIIQACEDLHEEGYLRLQNKNVYRRQGKEKHYRLKDKTVVFLKIAKVLINHDEYDEALIESPYVQKHLNRDLMRRCLFELGYFAKVIISGEDIGVKSATPLEEQYDIWLPIIPSSFSKDEVSKAIIEYNRFTSGISLLQNADPLSFPPINRFYYGDNKALEETLDKMLCLAKLSITFLKELFRSEKNWAALESPDNIATVNQALGEFHSTLDPFVLGRITYHAVASSLKRGKVPPHSGIETTKVICDEKNNTAALVVQMKNGKVFKFPIQFEMNELGILSFHPVRLPLDIFRKHMKTKEGKMTHIFFPDENNVFRI